MLATACTCALGVLIAVLICNNQLLGTHGAGAKTSTLASFNIQNLGPKKVSMPETLEILKRGNLRSDKTQQILSRYDVVAVQEIQDKSQTSINELLNALNKNVRKRSDRYAVVVSDRVGDTKGEEEQYGLIYKQSKVRVLRSQHYDDINDYFSRIPFLVELEYLTGSLPSFVVVNIHVKPDSSKNKATVKEIDHLVDVYDYVSREMGVENAILVGDMNAGGSYVAQRDWKNIRLRNQPRFQWLISDDEDSTVAKSYNAYDRIIVAGDELQAAIVPDSARVYRYDEEMAKQGMDVDQQEVLKVSDHYPVEVKIYLN